MTTSANNLIGYTCAVCGRFVANNSLHYCTSYSGTQTNYCPIHGYYWGFTCPSCRGVLPVPPMRLAWTCPVCGNGCAPHANTCSHAKHAPGPPQEDANAHAARDE